MPCDLLTEREDHIYYNKFNIDLLTIRLIDLTQFIQHLEKTKGMPLFILVASTGAASALRPPHFTDSISMPLYHGKGGPDLAFNELSKITAPTLLIIGGRDNVVIDHNKVAYKKLICERKLEIIPEATHLFEEKGSLQKSHFCPPSGSRPIS